MVQRNRQLPVCRVQKINMKSSIEKAYYHALIKKRNNKLFSYMKLSSGKNKKDNNINTRKNISIAFGLKATYRVSLLSQGSR